MNSSFLRKALGLSFLVMLLGLPGLAVPKKAHAQTACCSCTVVVTEFTAHKIWLINIFWEDNLLPALLLMSEQLTNAAMEQAQIIGMFMDAKQQLETQQALEKIRARAHKDYHPSYKYGLCEIGSSAKSLAASDRKAEFNAVVMSQRAQDRALGNAYSAAAVGDSEDKKSRIRQFREKFCDPADNNNGLRVMCDHDENLGTPETGAGDKKRMNKDIDYARTLDWPWTLNADFTDTVLTDNEEEILALSSNLYGQKIFYRPPPSSLKNKKGQAITNMQKLYLDSRSILAKQSVAENSFNAIASMKTAGLPGSREYLLALLEQLGIPNDSAATNGGPTEAEILLGADAAHPDAKISPSYYAQMEILTKKIYQNPDFFTHLYDTPANVARKQAAMQAIGLMQKFDLFKSYLRSEASLSVLLELAVMDLQDEIENEINPQGIGGGPARPRAANPVTGAQ